MTHCVYCGRELPEIQASLKAAERKVHAITREVDLLRDQRNAADDDNRRLRLKVSEQAGDLSAAGELSRTLLERIASLEAELAPWREAAAKSGAAA